MGLTFDADMVAAMPQVRRYCLRLVYHRRQDAEDLLQETLAQALEARASYTGGGMLTWLRAIARNRFLSDRRRAEHRYGYLDVTAEVNEAALPSIEGRQEGALIVQDVMRGLAALPAPHRAALLALRFDGDTYAEVAARHGVPEGTVKSQTHRLLARLSEQTGVPLG